MHVRDQDRVDRWQVLGVDAGLDQAFRDLTHGVGEDRVGQDEFVVQLHEHARVTDPERGQPRFRAYRLRDARWYAIHRPRQRAEVAAEKTREQAGSFAGTQAE